MIIVDKMFSAYLCLLLCNVVLSANISVHTRGYWHSILIRSPNQYIDNRFMSFTLKTCYSAYVYLLSGKTYRDSFYQVVIGGRYIKLYMTMWILWPSTKLLRSEQRNVYCNVDTDFFITWNDKTITVGFGLESNSSVFFRCARPTFMGSISHIRIRTYKSGEWTLYYTSGTLSTLSTSDEETVNITTFFDNLYPTNVPRHSRTTTANDLSTLSIGTSIPSQSYTWTEIMTMSVETTQVPETTTTDGTTTTIDGMPTTSEDFLSTITNVDTEISDTSAESASTKSTTSPLELVTTQSSLSVVGTIYTEPSTSTCKCNCPKTSVTSINYDLIDQLKIDKKTLSSYKRRRESATDPRKSSFYIGCIGITVLVISVAFIVLLDCIPRA